MKAKGRYGSWDEGKINEALMTGKHPKTGRDLNIDDIRAIKSAMAWRVAVEKGEPSALKVLARRKKAGLQ